jgi:hypothetical protein
MYFKNVIPFISFLMLASIVKSQTNNNLLGTSVWSTNLGSVGSVGGFNANGGATQNSILWGEDPFGKKSLIWKSIGNGNNGPNGGWDYRYIPINHLQAYRLTVWIKHETFSNYGYTYLGCDYTNTLNLNNTPNGNPYFGAHPNSLFTPGKWYLWVGYIHASTDNDQNNYGAVYDGETCQKVLTLVDYKMTQGATYQTHRSYNYYDQTVGSTISWYAPKLEEVNGSEIPVEQILASVGQSSTNNKNIFMGGNVGIGVINPSDKLVVDGNIKAKKLIITQTGWADYVFKPNYNLMSLDSLNHFIKEKQHLPGISDEKAIIKEGNDLGNTQVLLLKKIEELTLYIIQLNNKIEKQSKEIKQLQQKKIR